VVHNVLVWKRLFLLIPCSLVGTVPADRSRVEQIYCRYVLPHSLLLMSQKKSAREYVSWSRLRENELAPPFCGLIEPADPHAHHGNPRIKLCLRKGGYNVACMYSAALVGNYRFRYYRKWSEPVTEITVTR